MIARVPAPFLALRSRSGLRTDTIRCSRDQIMIKDPTACGGEWHPKGFKYPLRSSSPPVCSQCHVRPPRPRSRRGRRPLSRARGCQRAAAYIIHGPVTANVCKMAIGHDGQIHEQLARCCGRPVLRTSIRSLDPSPPGAWGKERRPQSLIWLRIRGSTFGKSRVS